MLRLTRITRTFGATRAVDDVSLELAPAAVTALIGENGAGKTTLMRIAAGELLPDSGSVESTGRVELVHQHFMLVNDFTIADNIALSLGSRPFLASGRTIVREAEAAIAGSGIELPDVTRRVADLSVGEKSRLELVKAIIRSAAVLVLDEPTSVLTPVETQQLFAVMRRLTAEGTSVVLISHKLREVIEVADRVVVMRSGRIVLDQPTSHANVSDLASAMVDQRLSDPADVIRTPPANARPVLVARSLRGEVLNDLSLTVAAGEIAAIVGVAGNGQSELAAILRGIRKPLGGELTIDAATTSHIPEDRTRDGLIGEMSIAENLALAVLRWSGRDSADAANRAIAGYSIRATGASHLARDLSGGNQQKVLLARELEREPGLVVAAEPTRGLDQEATRFVHARLRRAASSGAAILLITSDLDEALSLAGSIQVINRGRLSSKLSPEEARPRLGALMAGIE